MNTKRILLIGGIVSVVVFLSSLTESDPTILFGYSINPWFVRAFWLLNTFIIFNAYKTIKNKE